ncbi:673_t:CDS:2, partial [Dentiscutata erythropus]
SQMCNFNHECINMVVINIVSWAGQSSPVINTAVGHFPTAHLAVMNKIKQSVVIP